MKRILISLLFITAYVSGISQTTYTSEQIDSIINANNTINLGKFSMSDSVSIYYEVPKKTKEDYLKTLNISFNYFTQGYSDKVILGVQKEKIDKINIYISDFSIIHIEVYTEKGNIYTNNQSPIPLINNLSRYNDRLWNVSKSNYIVFGETIQYDPNYIDNYFPMKAIIRLTSENPSKELTEKKSLNTLINFNIYSDLLSMLGDDPNGLVQFETDAIFLLNYQNIIRTRITPFRYIKPQFNISKYDKKFAVLQTDTATVIKDSDTTYSSLINPMNLFQQSYLTFSTDINFFGDVYLEAIICL